MPLKVKTSELREWLKEFFGKKILYVGIGNVLKSDDGVGVYISRRIKQTKSTLTLTVEVSIENYIGKINTIKPDILVLIDCVDLHKSPGTYGIFEIDNIVDNTFNTHNISLNRLGDFFDMPTFILGIQPEKIEFGENLSKVIQKSADNILLIINEKEVNYG